VTTSAATRLGIQAAHNLARTDQCTFGPGMTEAELARVEQAYEFEFAADHRAFLSVGLPLDETAPRDPEGYYTRSSADQASTAPTQAGSLGRPSRSGATSCKRAPVPTTSIRHH
jgi:hypothetical protein